MSTPTRSFGRLGVALVAALVLAPTAWAQNLGSLRGVVSDSSGAVLPGATVVLVNEATKESRQVATDAKGGYFFAAVSPGLYTVRVEMPEGLDARTEELVRALERLMPLDPRHGLVKFRGGAA